MGTTAKGIVYPSDPTAAADLLTDLETLAQTTDTAIGNVQIPVDSALSPTSENPVQNKVITANIEDLEAENAELKNIIDQIVPATTQEGTDITLQNTLDAKIKSIIPKGNTSQFTTTGKNLFDYDETPVSLLKSGTRTINIEPPQAKSITAGTYTLSLPDLVMTNNSYNLNVQVFNGTENAKTTNINPSTKYATFTLDTNISLSKLYIYIGMSDNDNATATFSKIQLESGSSATSYEPYTNGASPNPDYPQQVKVVTGNNNVVISNRNLLENEATSTEINGVTFTNNADGSVLVNGTATANAVYYLNGSNSFTEDIQAGTYMLSSGLANTGSQTTYRLQVNLQNADANNSIRYINDSVKAILQNPTNKYRAYIVVYNGYHADNLLFKPMFEKGETATEYVKHQGATYPLSLGSIELCKIGTYQDYITGTIDNWKVVKNIKKRVLDGSESWSKQTGYYQCSAGLGAISGSGYANYYKYGSITEINNFALTTNQFRVNDSTDTLENYKTWLSTHNIILYYMLATPTEETITDTTLISQLNAIYNARSYSGQTNITSTYANEQMIISATALTQIGE